MAPVLSQASANLPNTDTLVFGDVASESAHGLKTGFGPVVAKVQPLPSDPSSSPASDVVVGALGQSARRLLPRTPQGDYYGGEARFTLKVDPTRENHFSLKMWGGDAQSLSWLVLEVDGFEVGARHMMKDETMLQNSNGWLPNRFIYRTVRLPRSLTSGKSSVAVRLRSLGWISYYAAPPYDNYQKRMASPSVGLYRAYSHVGAQPTLTGEVQGQALPMGSATTTAADEAAWLAAWKTQVNAMLNARMAASPGTLAPDDLDFLAQAHGVAWTTAYGSTALPGQVLSAFDAMVAAYAAMPATYFTQKFADHGGNADWGGYFGQVGRAITLLWPQLQSRLDVQVNYGGTLGVTSRRAAWAAGLRASVDHGRTHRRTIGNQVTDAAQRIYWANAALLLVDPSQALLETEARRYLYEAFGLMPWMGEDQPGGGQVPIKGTAPYGPNWYMITSRGTSKEDCLVGGDYGEVLAPQAYLLGQQINDNRLIQQGLKMLRARTALRLPAADDAGLRTLVVANAVGCRNDHQVNRHKAYLTGALDSVLVAANGAGAIGSDLLGYAQQQVDEGQLLAQLTVAGGNWMKGFAGWNRIVAVPEAYARFRAQPGTGVVLPMSSGQPDMAWFDDENMVIAARRGEERFFANLYWRGPEAINGLARVFVTSPTVGHLAEVSVDQVQYRPAGKTITLSRWVDATPVPGGFAPPDDPVNANVGLVLPQALRADLAAAPPINRDAGRGTAYALRYGNWLVAMNAHPTTSFSVTLPKEFGAGKDLVSGAWVQGPVALAPRTTMVFYMPDVTPPVSGPSGLFRLTVTHSGLSLSTSRDNASDRSTAKQKPYQSEANQKWTLEPLASGDYRVRVQASGLVLEAIDGGALGKNSLVIVRPDRNDDLQRWQVTQQTGSTYKLCAKRLPSACLSVQGASKARDASVVLAPMTGAAHQWWTLSTP